MHIIRVHPTDKEYSSWNAYSTVEMGPTREKIATDLKTNPLIGNFLLYTMVTL